MKKFLSFFLFFNILFFYSCGRDAQVSRGIASIGPGEFIPLSSKLTTNETDLALEICRSFRTKRLRIQARMFDADRSKSQPIDIKVEKGKCLEKNEVDDEPTTKDARFIPSVTDNGLPKYSFIDGEGSDLFSTDIETDESGHLKDVCKVLLDDENKNDPVVISYPNEDEVKLITFSEDNKFFVVYGEKVEGSDQYKLIQKTEFTLNLDSQKRYYGFVRSIEKETSCLSGTYNKTTQEISLPNMNN